MKKVKTKRKIYKTKFTQKPNIRIENKENLKNKLLEIKSHFTIFFYFSFCTDYYFFLSFSFFFIFLFFLSFFFLYFFCSYHSAVCVLINFVTRHIIIIIMFTILVTHLSAEIFYRLGNFFNRLLIFLYSSNGWRTVRQLQWGS